jgi:hypothetical protein
MMGKQPKEGEWHCYGGDVAGLFAGEEDEAASEATPVLFLAVRSDWKKLCWITRKVSSVLCEFFEEEK